MAGPRRGVRKSRGPCGREHQWLRGLSVLSGYMSSDEALCLSGHPSPPVALHQMSSCGFSQDQIWKTPWRREILPRIKGLGWGPELS